MLPPIVCPVPSTLPNQQDVPRDGTSEDWCEATARRDAAAQSHARNEIENPFRASEADIAAATPRYGTEMSRRFRGGGGAVSADDLPVFIGGALRIMSSSR